MPSPAPPPPRRVPRRRLPGPLGGAARRLGAIPLAAALALASCGAGAADADPAASQSPAELRRAVLDVVAAFEPVSAAASSSVHDDALRRQRLILARMPRAGTELGRALIEAFGERAGAAQQVRVGLLEAGALADPAGARETLIATIASYGEDMGLRTEACRILAQTSPEAAATELGELLFGDRPRITLPSDEALLAGWLRAKEELGQSPLPQLAYLAAEMDRDAATRHLAVRALGEHPSRRTTAALQEILVESTGDGYLRRLAAQSLVTAAPDELCAIVEPVSEREVDDQFRAFLLDVLRAHCGR